jgi:hypothetical protein
VAEVDTPLDGAEDSPRADSNERTPLPAIRTALSTVRDGLIHEADLDEAIAAALRAWLSPRHGRASSPYWPVEDVEALLGDCSDRD